MQIMSVAYTNKDGGIGGEQVPWCESTLSDEIDGELITTAALIGSNNLFDELGHSRSEAHPPPVCDCGDAGGRPHGSVDPDPNGAPTQARSLSP